MIYNLKINGEVHKPKLGSAYICQGKGNMMFMLYLDEGRYFCGDRNVASFTWVNKFASVHVIHM